MTEIEKSVKQESFSEELDIFVSLKKGIPEEWKDVYKDLTVTPYLNSVDMKEFELED